MLVELVHVKAAAKYLCHICVCERGSEWTQAKWDKYVSMKRFFFHRHRTPHVLDTVAPQWLSVGLMTYSVSVSVNSWTESRVGNQRRTEVPGSSDTWYPDVSWPRRNLHIYSTLLSSNNHTVHELKKNMHKHLSKESQIESSFQVIFPSVMIVLRRQATSSACYISLNDNQRQN